MGKENLCWAANEGHSIANATKVLNALQKAEATFGTRQAVVDVLETIAKQLAKPI